jgi:lipid-A-disaccharide synthase
LKYYIIAGEASGDLHGSNLIREMRLLDPAADVRCWGGDLMQAAGATLVKHYRELAFMGFVEVLANLRTILRNLSFCKQDILDFRPDVLVLIDYPGFNIRIAEWAKKQGLKVVYYISPQVWAWKESRVKTLKRSVDKMLCILPFEKEFYRKWNYEVEYVGHPLVEVIDKFKEAHPAQQQDIVALLPGSRRQEILQKLPVMLEVSKAFPRYRFVVAMAPGLEDAFYEPMLQQYNNVSAVRNQTYALLTESAAALVTSGTATLETALFGVPEVVCYKGSPISYQIARRLIRVPFISLVNLIMNRLVVKELIQQEMNTTNLAKELQELLTSRERQVKLKTDYIQLQELLRAGGLASGKAAKIITDFARA